MGSLLFDTIFNLVFYKHIGNLPFLFHHGLGFVCCTFGLYYHKMAIFGISIQACALPKAPFIYLEICSLKLAIRMASPYCNLEKPGGSTLVFLDVIVL